MTKLFLTAGLLAYLGSFAQDDAQPLRTGLVKPSSKQIEETRIIGSKLDEGQLRQLKPTVDLSLYLPVIEDQGISESCAAFAVASATTIVFNQRNKKTFKRVLVPPNDYFDYYFSPAYVFNLSKQKYPDGAKSSCDVGITYIDALNVAYTTGMVPWNAFPYKPSVCDCAEDPISYMANNKIEVEPQRIMLYQPVNINSRLFEYLLSSEEAVPICIGANIDQNYDAAGKHQNANQWLTKGVPLKQKNAYHAMVIVGFDQPKRLFKVVDSRGTGWGDQGSIYVSYDLVDNPTKPIDAAYIPLLSNKLLGQERVATNGSALPSNADAIKKWRLGINRYSIIDSMRIIFTSADVSKNLFNFQFKDDRTGEIIGEQLSYPFELDAATDVIINQRKISIQPYAFKKKVVSFYIRVTSITGQ